MSEPDATPAAPAFVLAEMNTAQYIFKGVGPDRPAARAALLEAWGRHRQGIVAAQPALAPTLPLPQDMERHFRIVYTGFDLHAGYRDTTRLV